MLNCVCKYCKWLYKRLLKFGFQIKKVKFGYGVCFKFVKKHQFLNMISDIKKYRERYKNSDLKRLTVTPEGGFFMSSKEIFNNKEESLELIDKLRNSVKSYKKKNKRFAAVYAAKRARMKR